MIVFCVDLDNTLIYSYKHIDRLQSESGPNMAGQNASDQGSAGRHAAAQGSAGQNAFGQWICVETYQGREISFISRKTHHLLMELKERALIVPVTTRTVEQYRRIDLQIGNISYALACNGGILLHMDRTDDAWYRRSFDMVQESRTELQRAAEYLSEEKNRIFELRVIEDLFVFTKCKNPAETTARMQGLLDLKLTDVFYNGEKVYVVPKQLNKGNALKRFRDYIRADYMLSAGDSIFDRPMLHEADLAAAPAGCAFGALTEEHIHVMPGKKLFSEELLAFLLNKIKK